jgi:predicted DNA repair protein MutK
MIKTPVLAILILLISTPLSANSLSYTKDLILAKKSHKIAKKIGTVALAQNDIGCREYTAIATVASGFVGPEIIIRQYKKAKDHLHRAITHLQYAQNGACKKTELITELKNKMIGINQQINI